MGAHRTQWLSMLKDYPPEEASRLIEAAVQADPTPGHVYITWLLRQLREGWFRLPEQAPKVRDLLVRWQQVKRANTFKADRDINRYTYADLRRLVEQTQASDSVRKRQRHVKRQGAETVYEDGRYRIVRLTHKNAVMALARGTRWCTGDPNSAAIYLQDGPFHLIFRDGVRYALLHFASGEIKNEEDAKFVPDGDLAEVLERIFPPTTLADAVGLCVILGRPLATIDQEREMLRYWSDGYDPDKDLEVPIESATTYLQNNYPPGSARLPQLAKMVQESLAEGRLDVAWQLDSLGILPLEEIVQPLHRAILNCYAARNFKALDQLLHHFRGSDLMATGLDYFADELIEFVWNLIRLEPGTRLTLLSTPLKKKAPERARRNFVAFYKELRQIWADRRAGRTKVARRS
jgi:hypothetical protein